MGASLSDFFFLTASFFGFDWRQDCSTRLRQGCVTRCWDLCVHSRDSIHVCIKTFMFVRLYACMSTDACKCSTIRMNTCNQKYLNRRAYRCEILCIQCYLHKRITHTCTRKERPFDSKASSHTCLRTYIHTYTHTHIHTYMHACIHAYILIYMCTGPKI